MLAVMKVQRNYESFTIRSLLLKHCRNCNDLQCPCSESQSKSSPEPNILENTVFTSVGECSKMVRKLTKRSRIMLKILFYKLNKNYSSNCDLTFLYLFANITEFDHFYSSYFQLTTFKGRSLSGSNKQNFEHLNLLCLKKVQFMEKSATTIERIEMDLVMQTERQFEDYKKLLLEQVIVVESFWVQQMKQDQDILEIIEMGVKIADNYIKSKLLYDDLIRQKPDFKELVKISIQYLQQVMNFEEESFQQINILKNIDQKNKILKKSQYKISNDSFGMLIVSQNKQSRNRVIYSNQKICLLLGYEQRQFKTMNIKSLMPGTIANIHDNLIDDYFKKSNSKTSSEIIMNRVWPLTSEGLIKPMTLTLQICISEAYGICFLAYFNPFQEITAERLTLNPEQAYILVIDETGVIRLCSQTFRRKYPRLYSEIIEDNRVSLEDLFPGISQFSNQEVSSGISITLNINFHLNEAESPEKFRLKEVNVTLVIVTHVFGGEQQFKEIIFTEQNGGIQNQKKGERDDNSRNQQDQVLFTQIRLQEESLLSDSHGSGSSASMTSTTSNEIQQLKQQINLKKMPQSIQNMKTAMILFFLTLIATSFSILAVVEISKYNFATSFDNTEYSKNLPNWSSNMRLSLHMMLLSVKQNYPGSDRKKDYIYFQTRLDEYLTLIDFSLDFLMNDKSYIDPELLQYTHNNSLKVIEVQQNGKVEVQNTSFYVGMSQYLTKYQQFINITYQEFQTEFKNFQLRNTSLLDSQLHRDLYFLFMNGNGDLNDKGDVAAYMYVLNSQFQVGNFRTLFLSITMVCIFVTALITSLMMPVTFSLDSDMHKVVKKWLLIKEASKKEICKNINMFTEFLHSDINEKSKQDEHVLESSASGENEEIKNSVLTQSNFLSLNNIYSISEDHISQNSLLLRIEGKLFSLLLNSNTCIYSDSIDQIFNYEKIQLKQKLKVAELMKRSTSQIEKALQKQAAFRDGPLKNKFGKQLFSEAPVKIDVELGVIQSTTNTKKYTSSSLGQFQNAFKSNISRVVPISEGVSVQEISVDLDSSQVPIRPSKNNLSIKRDEAHDIFKHRKCLKGVYLSIYGLFICGFYISMFLSATIVFQQFKENFQLQYNYNDLFGCGPKSLLTVFEESMLNSSYPIDYGDYTPFTFVQTKCSSLLSLYKSDALKSAPKQLKEGSLDLIKRDSNENCEITYSDPSEIESCRNYWDGIFLSGWSKVYQTLHYFVIQKLIYFESIPGNNRTQIAIDNFLMDQDLVKWVYLNFDHLNAMWVRGNVIFDGSLSDHLDMQLSSLTVGFVLFIVVLIASLVGSLQFVLGAIKRIDLRTRILIKIIPAKDLKEISNIEQSERENY